MGRPSVGMAGAESSPFTLGAKLTVLKEGGGGRGTSGRGCGRGRGTSGKLSITVRLRATLRLLGSLELDWGGSDSLLLSSVFMKAKVFLVKLSHKQN